uniref:CSON005087 protein n=1 Tax=Culicoides sonorensis TaxID=179676 RepID=A0A336LXI7_CULSO
MDNGQNVSSSSRSSCRAYSGNAEEEIVISGISGAFPNAHNVAEFCDKLYAKIDMVDEDERRWKHLDPRIPKRHGKIYDLDKFDASFFGIHNRQANNMDPQGRVLLETAYVSIMDAGINPQEIRGKKVGVFIGLTYNEAEKFTYDQPAVYNITGHSRAMLANRISYCLNLTGPSFVVDTACSSSFYALDCAYSAIRNGECESALVCGSNLCLHPYISLQFSLLNMLSKDGYCSPFDEKADGYIRAEAVCCIYLQKAKNAKRVYCTLVHSKVNCDGYKDEGIFYPSRQMQVKLVEEFYKEINFNPNLIDYVEAHGTGTAVGDPIECFTIDSVIARNRTKSNPLLIGSVKSNMGHSEPASGVCSIAKIVCAFQKGLIPPNLHLTKPRQSIDSIREGRIKVVTDVCPLTSPYVAANSYGFGGANAHILLKAHPVHKVNHGLPTDNLKRLVLWSGRTQESVELMLNSISQRALDTEFLALLTNIQRVKTPGYVYRGFGIYSPLNEIKSDCHEMQIQHFHGEKRPLVWVFAGMGSQWIGMGSSLMEIQTFRHSIEECHKILLPYGLDLVKIITDMSDSKMFDNVLHSFVGIAAIQIGIVNVLRDLKVFPDIIIGHSVGELGCAYADECFTLEEMILSAYYRGLVSTETKVTFGAMAAIGVGYQKIKASLPDGIEVACHNSPDSCTISGPAQKVSEFVSNLKNQGIFAKEVPCSNIPYHSKYIQEMGPKLMEYLQKVIKIPKQRSRKWLSTSIPKENWNKLQSQFCSAEYQTNNLLSPVLFEETMKLIPENAITLEIAPHGLLQSILKNNLPKGVHIPLTQRANQDNFSFFLNGLGKLYVHGIEFTVDKLYPPVKFPVSLETSMIAPLIRWEHSQSWFVASFNHATDAKVEHIHKINLTDELFANIVGHKIDGRILFPATSYLMLTWHSYALMLGIPHENMNVEFKNVKFMRATAIPKDSEVKLSVTFQRGSGLFEITEGITSVVSGEIYNLETLNLSKFEKIENNSITLYTKDIYKELRLRGYEYSGDFKSLTEARMDAKAGKIRWLNDYAPFIDCMLQLTVLSKDTRSLYLPVSFDSIKISPSIHAEIIQKSESIKNEVKVTEIEVTYNKNLKLIKAGGVEIQGLHARAVNRKRDKLKPVLETYKFIPYFSNDYFTLEDASRCIIQLGLENSYTTNVKIYELQDGINESLIEKFVESLCDLPLIIYETTSHLLTETPKSSTKNNSFVICSYMVAQPKIMLHALKFVKEDGLIISREATTINPEEINIPKEVTIVSSLKTLNETLLVFKPNIAKYENSTKKSVKAVKVSLIDTNYNWLNETQKLLKKEHPVILYAQNEPLSGIIGLVNCIRKELTGDQIRCVFIDDESAPSFNLESAFYMKNVKLAVNIFKNGTWGSYRHLPLNFDLQPSPEKRHCIVNCDIAGDLSSLKWFEGHLNFPDLKVDPSLLVNVKYSALNFRDLMLTTGRLTKDSINIDFNRIGRETVIGLEFAGVTMTGKKIFGYLPSRSIATKVLADKNLLWECPPHMTLEDAATIPIVYTTVYYAFFIVTKIQKGQKVLIHAGTGGVGLAAIHTAIKYGLEVFTTVGSDVKRQYLLKKFPTLRESHIGNSRDTSFYEMVMRETDGKGVDYVLNSLSEEKLIASVKCLGKRGKFLEIGKFDMENNSKLGLAPFLNEISFHSIILDAYIIGTSAEKKYITNLIETDLKNGAIMPLPTTIFNANDVEQAFRYMGSAKHIGKVLLKIRDKDEDEKSLPITVNPRVYCHPDLTYIIIGGLGGFGLELADWLIIRGCTKLVLSSTRGITKPYQCYRISLWRSYGIDVTISTADITTLNGVTLLIEESSQHGSIGGIFNLAVKLQDATFENQSPSQFRQSMAPKALATIYLDEVSRIMCPKLHMFVVFSSVSCGRGNAGQSNYGMANSVMERVIEQRRKRGLPGKAIQWGAIGDVGLVADMQSDKNIEMAIGGTLPQKIASCMEELDKLLSCPDPIVASMVVAEKNVNYEKSGDIVEAVMNIMGIHSQKSIQLDTKFSDLGLDSLMSVEINQLLERDYEIFLSPQELRVLTFDKLQALADVKSDSNDTGLKDTAELGLNLIQRNLGDEKSSLETVLRLMNMNNNDDVERFLFIPGIEGVCGEAWTQIASKINLPVFMLQLRKTAHMIEASQIAESILKDLLKHVFNKTHTFRLVGYSFGTIITLEIARILEGLGKNGKILLIDGSPQYLKQITRHLNNNKAEFTDSDVHAIMIKIMKSLIPLNEIQDKSNWNSFKKVLISTLAEHFKFSEEYCTEIIDSIASRIKLMANAEEEPLRGKIRSDIVLVRPTDITLKVMSEDYGLSKYTEGKIDVKVLQGNHSTILENEGLLKIINAMEEK